MSDEKKPSMRNTYTDHVKASRDANFIEIFLVPIL